MGVPPNCIAPKGIERGLRPPQAGVAREEHVSPAWERVVTPGDFERFPALKGGLGIAPYGRWPGGVPLGFCERSGPGAQPVKAAPTPSDVPLQEVGQNFSKALADFAVLSKPSYETRGRRSPRHRALTGMSDKQHRRHFPCFLRSQHLP